MPQVVPENPGNPPQTLRKKRQHHDAEVQASAKQNEVTDLLALLAMPWHMCDNSLEDFDSTVFGALAFQREISAVAKL